MRQAILLITTLASALLLVGCRDKGGSEESVSDSEYYTLEAAVSEAGAAAGSSEGASISAMLGELRSVDEIATEGVDWFTPMAACSYSSNRSCGGSTGTIAWSSCTIGSVVMTGGWSESFSSGACCSSFGNSCSVTRTTSSSEARFPRGATLTTSTDSHSTWDNTTLSGGSTISMSGGTRTFTINGVQRILRGPRGTVWFNHSLKTTTDLQITGTRALGSRTVQQGTLVVYHNRARYTATNVFDTTNKVIWGSSSCCYPTGGKITTSLTGSISGTMSLEFTSCGYATFTATNGSQSTVQLSQCQ